VGHPPRFFLGSDFARIAATTVQRIALSLRLHERGDRLRDATLTERLNALDFFGLRLCADTAHRRGQSDEQHHNGISESGRHSISKRNAKHIFGAHNRALVEPEWTAFKLRKCLNDKT
jgi:hypothetical protein